MYAASLIMLPWSTLVRERSQLRCWGCRSTFYRAGPTLVKLTHFSELGLIRSNSGHSRPDVGHRHPVVESTKLGASQLSPELTDFGPNWSGFVQIWTELRHVCPGLGHIGATSTTHAQEFDDFGAIPPHPASTGSVPLATQFRRTMFAPERLSASGRRYVALVVGTRCFSQKLFRSRIGGSWPRAQVPSVKSRSARCFEYAARALDGPLMAITGATVLASRWTPAIRWASMPCSTVSTPSSERAIALGSTIAFRQNMGAEQAP